MKYFIYKGNDYKSRQGEVVVLSKDGDRGAVYAVDFKGGPKNHLCMRRILTPVKLFTEYAESL